MLSRQIIQKAVKANVAAFTAAKRFSHDISFPVKNSEMHLHESYDAFVGRTGILWQPTPTKLSKTQARANFKASILAKKAEADKLYAELDEADKAIFDDFFKDALNPKVPVESGVFKPYGPLGKQLSVFHHGGYMTLLSNSLKTKKNFPIMFLSVIFALAGTGYIFLLAILNIRAYFDGILHPHH